MSSESSEPLFNKMAVIGVGLIGGSLGMAAKSYNLAGSVAGYGRSLANLEDAVQLGAIDSIATSPRDCVDDADIVFVCTPVRTVSSTLCEIAESLKEGAVVTDVGSSKRLIVEQAEAIVPKGRHFIGGHPMAGTEKSGAVHAFPELFKSATYVLTPQADTDSSVLQKLRTFVERLGARCEIMNALDHDKSVAAISHLPHVIASALLAVAEHSNAETGKSFRLAAGSFRDVTRIAESPPEIWRDICVTNADLICDEIDEFAEWMGRFKNALVSRDEQELMKLFEQGSRIRKAYNRTPK